MRRFLLIAVFVAAPLACVRANSPYAAMGSSFAAGPGIAKAASDSTAHCTHSTENYAHLLAHARDLDLRDVSCPGATTADILDGSAAIPPQLDAVTPETSLVTVTIGGNDVGFIRNLYAWSCLNQSSNPSTCSSPMSGAEVEAAFAALPERMSSIIERVHARSPQALVVFVDYIRLIPDSGSCPSRLPLTAAQMEQARSVAKRLAALTAEAAQANGAVVLKASELSVGHDVCSADPWATPYNVPSGTPANGFAPYHPNAAAMRAIALKLGDLLSHTALPSSGISARQGVTP